MTQPRTIVKVIVSYEGQEKEESILYEGEVQELREHRPVAPITEEGVVTGFDTPFGVFGYVTTGDAVIQYHRKN